MVNKFFTFFCVVTMCITILLFLISYLGDLGLWFVRSFSTGTKTVKKIIKQRDNLSFT